jgi:hypothetical protein
MPRVLLLFPRLNNFVFFGVYEPLVLEILSAIAKEESCEVELIDLRLEPNGCDRLARRGYVPEIIGLTTHGFPEVPIRQRNRPLMPATMAQRGDRDRRRPGHRHTGALRSGLRGRNRARTWGADLA